VASYTITIPDQAEFDATIADLCLVGGRREDELKTPGEFAHAQIVSFLFNTRVQAAQIRAAQEAQAALIAVQSQITSGVTA